MQHTRIRQKVSFIIITRSYRNLYVTFSKISQSRLHPFNVRDINLSTSASIIRVTTSFKLLIASILRL